MNDSRKFFSNLWYPKLWVGETAMTWRDRKAWGNQRSPSPRCTHEVLLKTWYKKPSRSFRWPGSYIICPLGFITLHATRNVLQALTLSAVQQPSRRNSRSGVCLIWFSCTLPQLRASQSSFLLNLLVLFYLQKTQLSLLLSSVTSKSFIIKKCVLNFMWGFNSSSRKAVK